ncbi:MAG: Gfo/Idh/MocA family oxidoreductase, partial [Clostridia bacterium]
MIMAKLKAAFVGCGGIASGKHLPALSKVEEVEIIAFCDLDINRANWSKETYGTKDAKTYIDYKKMIDENKDIDIIYVCTPNRSHAEISIYALESGKHVMCEKPMARTAQEARDMVAAAKKSGKKLTIGYQNRQRTDSKYLKQCCDAGELGEIYFAKAHAIRRRAVPTWGVFLDEYNQGGGSLIDIGTHALDLTLWMMNNYEPKMVVGTSYKKLGQQKDTGNAWGDWDPEKFTVEDSAFGYVVMKNGATVFIESSWALNTLETGEAQTTLCGTNAGASMRGRGLTINGAKHGKLFTEMPQLSADGVDFYDPNNGPKPE